MAVNLRGLVGGAVLGLAAWTQFGAGLPGYAALRGAREPAASGDVAVLSSQPYRRTQARANTFTGSAQENAAFDFYADGGLVVAWESRRQEAGTYGVYLQRFDAAGQPAGGETHVNVYTRNMQMRPDVVVDPAGGTWVAWESFGQDGSMNSIIARRFSPGFGAGTDEVLVNQTSKGQQSDVVLAPYSDGGVLAVWTTAGKSENRRRVVGRRLDASGQPGGAEFVISESAEGEGPQPLPSVAALGNDRVVVVWAATNEAGQPVAIRGRFVDGRGLPEGKVVQLASGSGASGPIEPSVCRDHQNGFAAAWLASTGSEYAVWAARFDSSGEPAAPPFRVSGDADYQVNGAAVAADLRGRLAVAWNARSLASKDADVFVTVFNADGKAVGQRIRVNAQHEGSQRLAIATGKQRLAWSANGRLAAAWQGDSEPGIAGGNTKSAHTSGERDAEIQDVSREGIPALVGARRDSRTSGAVAHGAGGRDKSGVSVTVLTPGEDSIALVTPSADVAGGAAEELAASPHVPPEYDPDTVPREPFGGDPLAGTRGTATSFLGITNTGWNPPDPHLAAGPAHVVAMTNGAIAFFTKDGVQTFQDEIEDSFGFWGSVGATNFVFDPEVIYDPHTDRFMAMACERSNDNKSFYLLAVSDDANPNGSWHKYRLDVTALAGNDIDSPNIGVDAQAVYLTADFFGPDTYLVFIVEKAAVLVGAAPLTRNLLITGAQSMGIPVVYEADAPAQYLVQAHEGLGETEIRLHAITDPLGTPQRVTFGVPVPAYGIPEDPPQMGTAARPELFEARIWSCALRNDSLWVVHHQDFNRVRVRYYEIRLNNWPDGGTPQMIRTGEIDPGAPVRTFFPSIWVDDAGSAVITCARSSPSEFISMCRAVSAVGDPQGFRPLEFVIQSAAPFVSGRWGDYSATVQDPVRPGKFWGMHEYTPGGNSWNTWIARYHAGPCDTKGDDNADCAIDLADMEDFSDCMWGFAAPGLFTCRCFDFDDDTFVALNDFAEFQVEFTAGAAIPGCEP